MFIALFTLGFGSSLQAQTVAGRRHRQFPPGSVNKPEDLPASRFRSRLERLSPERRQRAVAHLQRFHFTELDLDTLDVDDEGAVLYIDHFTLDDAGVPATAEALDAAAGVPVSPFPASLVLHSRPGAPNVLFLNFSGEAVTNTAWNNSLRRSIIPAVAFSTDGDFTTFSDAEQAAIRSIWQRVAEDYAPFNIDVTTERPATLGTRAAMALVTRSTDANGAANPSSTAGGVAYIDSFATSTYAKYRPAWIYYDNLSSTESYIAEAASHEIGHNMGLSHDGRTDGSQYYGGHGTGETSWGPLMGTGYGRNVSQWSKGEYYLANNTEDDLAIIAAKVSYRSDDHGNTPETATALVLTSGTNIVSTTPQSDPGNASPANKGVLEQNTDVDVFSFSTGSGTVRLNVNPWIMASGTRGGNVDVAIELRDSAGNLVATNNSATATGAQIQNNVTAGTYYLYVRNSGAGTPLAATPSGYTPYGSIGQYFISGSIAPASASPLMIQLATSANNPAWGSVTPSGGSYADGTAVQLVATPGSYYQFLWWTNGATGTINPLTVTLHTNISITAVFGERFTTSHPTPYSWLASYGYTNNFEAAAELIGANGLPLWQSYLAGLNPTAPVTAIRLGITRLPGGGTLLRWNTTPGLLYTIWSSTNVSSGFTPLAGGANLPSTITSFTNTQAGTSGFYRVAVSGM